MDIYLTPRDKRANVDTIRWFFELLKKTLDDSCRGATLELLAGSGGKYASLNNVMTKSVEEDAGSALVYSEVGRLHFYFVCFCLFSVQNK